MKSIIVLLIIFVSNSIVNSDSGLCKTPVTLKDGSCVPIEACRNLNAVKNNPVYKLYLDRSKCQTNTKLSGVCCEKQEIDTQVAILFGSQDANTTNAARAAELRTHAKFSLLNNEDCGQNIYDRISYGNLTKVFEHPWMALLKYKDFDGEIGYYCGGSLISKKYVLTAAHCLKSVSRQLIQVRLGEHDLNKMIECIDKDDEKLCTAPVQDINVDKIIPHPMYNKQQRIHDIGLVRLNKSANLNEDSITPICLPVLEYIRGYRPKNYIVVGWGSTEKGQNSDVLLQAKIFPVARSTCEQNLQVKLKTTQICAGGNGKVDNCQGDSGGPLTAVVDELKYVQYGIVSFGQKGCGEKELPGVYTNVAEYMQWILDTLES